jgi:hypothetical protein
VCSSEAGFVLEELVTSQNAMRLSNTEGATQKTY